MSFAENIKKIRKERGLTQEELAEIMEVSRQAVSKWESGEGYPEVEKLLFLANRFNISLDALMSTEIAEESFAEPCNVTGHITISSPNENVVATCHKVLTSQKLRGGKKSPRYALYGVGSGGNYFWGEPTVFLGWYADRETISKEVDEIQKALARGIPNYQLRYSVKVERKWLRISMVEE